MTYLGQMMTSGRKFCFKNHNSKISFQFMNQLVLVFTWDWEELRWLGNMIEVCPWTLDWTGLGLNPGKGHEVGRKTFDYDLGWN